MTAVQEYRVSSAVSMDGVRDGSVALVVTSPPYPMISMWDASFSDQAPGTAEALSSGDGETAFELMHGFLDRVWAECRRVLIPGGILCINIGDAVRKLSSSFRLYSNHSRILSACSNLGFEVLPLILWRKQTNAPTKFMGSGMLPGSAYATLEHEYILILRNGGKRVFSTEEEKAARRASAYFWEERNAWFSDLWEFKGIRQSFTGTGARDRSAAFPLELAYRLVRMYSVRGDTVIDPFLGTGTAALACLETGRNFTGYEIDGSFIPGILEAVRSFSLVVNGRISSGLARHVEFMENYAKKRTPRHMNAFHGFPVVTSQERDIVIPFVESVEVFDAGASVVYGPVPSGSPAPVETSGRKAHHAQLRLRI